MCVLWLTHTVSLYGSVCVCVGGAGSSGSAIAATANCVAGGWSVAHQGGRARARQISHAISHRVTIIAVPPAATDSTEWSRATSHVMAFQWGRWACRALMLPSSLPIAHPLLGRNTSLGPRSVLVAFKLACHCQVGRSPPLSPAEIMCATGQVECQVPPESAASPRAL